MITSKNTPRIIALVLSAALGACASNPAKLSSKDRAAIQTVQLVSPPQGARPLVYNDKTSGAALEAATYFGPITTIVAAKSVKGHIEANVSRWAIVTQGHEARVLQLVREAVQNQFVQSGKLRFSDNAPVDAQLLFRVISYGVSHAGNQRFNVTIEVRMALVKSDGKEAWKPFFFAGSSSSGFTLEEYQHNPKAYASGLEEAANKVAQSIVSAY